MFPQGTTESKDAQMCASQGVGRHRTILYGGGAVDRLSSSEDRLNGTKNGREYERVCGGFLSTVYLEQGRNRSAEYLGDLSCPLLIPKPSLTMSTIYVLVLTRTGCASVLNTNWFPLPGCTCQAASSANAMYEYFITSANRKLSWLSYRLPPLAAFTSVRPENPESVRQ